MIRKVIVLLAFGCLWPAVGRGQEAPVSVTVQSPSTEAPAQTAQQSPVVLDDLLREALQKNPAVRSILRQVEALRHRIPQVKTLPDPTVSVGWAGNITPFSVQQGDPSSYRGVSASQAVPYPGKLKLRGEIADREAQAAWWDYESARRKLVADVKSAYYDYFAASKAVEITKQNKDLLQKLSSIAEARYRVGKGVQQDVLRSQVPLGQVADIRVRSGPGMIRDENGRVSGYVYVDVSGRDIGSYVTDAKKAVMGNVKIPPGYQLVWSGQYEFMERVRERLKMVVPITLFIVFLLLYFNTGSIVKTFIILLAVPFSAIGAVWLLYLLGYNMSIAVWVGLIALLGVDAETAVFMLLYLDLAYHEAQKKGQMRSWDDLREAIINGAVKRLRPKIMTVACMLFALLPILWSVGSGADVMKRIAAPPDRGNPSFFLDGTRGLSAHLRYLEMELGSKARARLGKSSR
jgi:AcrB/AcrD/AcrF family/Outer membrane efflux protein